MLGVFQGIKGVLPNHLIHVHVLYTRGQRVLFDLLPGRSRGGTGNPGRLQRRRSLEPNGLGCSGHTTPNPDTTAKKKSLVPDWLFWFDCLTADENRRTSLN